MVNIQCLEVLQVTTPSTRRTSSLLIYIAQENRLHLQTSRENKIIVIRNVVSQAHSKPNSRIMMFTRTILPHIYKTQAPRQLPCTVKTRGTKKSHVPLSQQNRYVPAKIVINNTNKLSKSGTHTKSKYRCHTTSPAVSGTFSQEISRKY